MIMEEVIKDNSKIRNYDNVSYNIEIDNKPKADKTYNLYLRVTQNRKHKRKKLFPIESKQDFNKNAAFGKWIRTSDSNSVKLNEEIEKAIEEAKAAKKEIKGTSSSTAIIRKIKGTDSKDFFQYAIVRAEFFYNTGGYRNYKKYNNFINRLKEYHASETLNFSEIDYEFIKGFETFLNKKKNVRRPEFNIHKNTIAGHMKIFRAILKQAEISKFIRPADNPFLSYKPEEKHTNKEKLSAKEITAIEGLKLSQNSILWHCRNYFLFSFYCAGIRAGDLILLKWNNVTKEGRLDYTIGKTSCSRSIKLFPKAKKILNYYKHEGQKPNEYIFPLLDNNAPFAIANNNEERNSLPADIQKKMYNTVNAKNSFINKYLKEIAQLAEIKKPLSFHISRHSFADIARKKNASVYDISKLLGHSSIKITEAYLKNFDSESMDKTMEGIMK